MKRILTLLVLLSLATDAVAQKSSWYIGARAGVSVSSITNYNASYGYDAGFTGGVFGEYKHRSGFAVELDLLYARQGAAQSQDDYLLLPLKLKYYIPCTGGLNVFVGPQLDQLLSNPIGILSPPGGEPIESRTTTVSLTAGLGCRFKFGLELTANNNYGLQDLVKNLNQHYRNSVFQFTVRYDVFRFGAK